MGVKVMHRCFPLVPQLLPPRGLFYLVIIKENNPEENLKTIKMEDLQGTTAISRHRSLKDGGKLPSRQKERGDHIQDPEFRRSIASEE